MSEAVQGTKGTCDVNRHVISPKSGDPWRHKNDGDKDPYQQEHDDLFDAIRNNKEYNEAENGAMSSMTAILGRLATYSGKEVEMDKVLKSELTIFPNPSSAARTRAKKSFL